MIITRLYIENFMCYDRGFIDFTQFSTALIVGKVDHNDLHSNGVGKTSIFKAIEYVLFNQSDVNLEKIIRDDADYCRIVMDFKIADQEYRISRKRTKKGSTDLCLLKRTAKSGDDIKVYHSITTSGLNDIYTPYTDKKDIDKYWNDLSGSRAGDTEKDLAKLIKINPKSFRSTIHFMQNDFSGLQSATPEKRKAILKDALNLAIYYKLEKIAKDRASLISKDIDKNKILFDALGDPDKELLVFSTQLSQLVSNLKDKNDELSGYILQAENHNSKINELINEHSNLESKFSSLLSKEQVVCGEKSRLEISVKEYKSKTSNVSKAAKSLIDEVKELKNSQIKLVKIDYNQIDIMSEQIEVIKNNITYNNVLIQNKIKEYEELKVPVPDDSICKHCRSPITDEHKKICKANIARDIKDCQKNIASAKKIITEENASLLSMQQEINSLKLKKQQLEGINTQITLKNKEIQDKHNSYNEYSELLSKFESELSIKINELNNIRKELEGASIEEAKNIKNNIDSEKKKLTLVNNKINILNKDISVINNNRAIMQHNIDQKNKDKVEKERLKEIVLLLEKKFKVYPFLLQAFSSVGIPNLIIQNVLDDLQIEANNLLLQLKPGLQLSFFIEKTQGDGTETDTLDIKYHINGKERYYEQLSGAMKLAVTFSLKLGLSFLLQKMIGTDIKFLLLDEIDQSLDKASVDAFADIVKFFQKDFTILIITHNDRLKDKFSHAILVEQDINMVSRAKVVSSW